MDSGNNNPPWPEAIFGPPPWRVYDEDWAADPMDIAVGKFVRAIPLLETMLKLTSCLVVPSRSWVDVEEKGPTAALNAVRECLTSFPTGDQHWIELHLGEAARVLDLRQAIMHGLWTEADPEVGIYLSERPLRRSDAKRLTGVARLPDDQHPTWRREFNAIGVMAARSRARSVSRYLERHHESWASHLGQA